MKTARFLFLCLILLVLGSVDVRAQDAPARAFDNVIIHRADGSTIDSGTIVWRDGIIEAVGADVDIPFDAYVVDGGDSLHAYPGFIDGLALWGSPDLPDRYETPDRPGEPGYERAGIQPQRSPNRLLKKEDKNLAQAQKHGFTTAVLGLKGQMLPGQLDLFFINGKETGNYLVEEGIGLHAQFEEAPGGFGSGAYPATLMGVMANIRQLWYEATALKTQMNYYANSSGNYPVPKGDEVLESLFPVMDKEQPLFFVADTKENIEHLFTLQDELDFEVVLVSGKEAYKKADELKARDIPVLASIDLPEKPKWKVKEEKAEADTAETEAEEPMEEISEEMRIFRERQLQAYKADIENIGKLVESGVMVGYASNGMKLSDIGKHVTTLVEEGGLSSEQVLGLFTRHTADILGVGGRMGDLETGNVANISIYTKPFTEKKAKVRYSVSDGVLTDYESASESNNSN